MRVSLGVLALTAAAVAAPATVRAQAAAELYLEVSLNGEGTGMVLAFRQGPDGLRSTAENFRQLGLELSLFGLAGRQDFGLDEAHGLTFRFDPATQTLALTVNDALRTPTQIDSRQSRPLTASVGTGRGALLNYQLYSQFNTGGRVAGLHELRWFNQGGVISSTGTITLRGEGRAYTRLDTFWTRSDPTTLETVQVGDLITNALPWSRSLRLGGVQWRRNFELRPDVLTYPMPALRGSALVPTAVSLYVNGMQQIDAQVPSGPFIINHVTGLNGAGQANIVTRDELGRTTATTLPLYIDTRMLAEGLSEYSVESGFVRRDYGARSLAYAKSPAASASLRYGWREQVTLELHGEGGRGLANAGAGALLRLGQLGVASGAIATSVGKQQGVQASVGYQYISSGYSFDAQSIRRSPRYADLASGEGTPPPLRTDRLSLNFALPRGHSLGGSYIALTAPGVPRARITALAYSASILRRAYLSLSAYRDLDKREARGVSFNFSIPLGERTSASATAGRQEGRNTRNVVLSRAADYGGGFGWALQTGGVDGGRYRQGQLQYLGSAGQITLLGQENGNTSVVAVDASGSLVIMDGTVSAARQVGNSFALISTGTPDLPVMHENRQLGRTNGRGYLLVPNLVPYTNNLLSIDTSALPADARVKTDSLAAVPQRLAGVLVRFPVEAYAAATVILRGSDGKVLPVGTVVVNSTSGQETVVGYDGMAFVDQLRRHNRLLLGSGAGQCEVQFDYSPTVGTLPTIGPLQCRPVGERP